MNNIPDTLDEEFRKLEREVFQRECPHETVYKLQTIGQLPTWMCTDCGKRFDRDPRWGQR